MADSSALPAPSELEKYEQVLPGSAERIVALAERRSDRDLWVQKLLAREERFTRLLSYGSLLIAASGACVGFAAFFLKAFEH
ncbi:DUF2335 domain-containing protein [Methylobacterium sp. J-026]|uniref:DUF2335 domain-containing protein n=1 Tax=Methylobacterium sp. J-026 TaxID=2836624 RepID=UPI001FBA107F|nr:DUF2335 domain-containing protein [Methylobacterium sp. J-026]MCJ2137022.1 DUF2335 domain-containing protein [Methylobacterium sp. J-026]